MTTNHSKSRPNPQPDVGPSIKAFTAITCSLESIAGFAKSYVVKTLQGPEPALVVCRRADGEPVVNAWVKQEPGTGRLYRDFIVGGQHRGSRGSARQLFRDPDGAAAYLKSVLVGTCTLDRSMGDHA